MTQDLKIGYSLDCRFQSNLPSFAGQKKTNDVFDFKQRLINTRSIFLSNYFLLPRICSHREQSTFFGLG